MNILDWYNPNHRVMRPFYYELLVPVGVNKRREIYFNRESALQSKRSSNGELFLCNFIDKTKRKVN